MSIQSEIDRLKADLAAAYAQIAAMGGTLPTAQNATNLKDAISTIPKGIVTSDATATASDIAAGKTAYGKDGLITGETSTVSSMTLTNASLSKSGLYLMTDARTSVKCIVHPNSQIILTSLLSKYGDATAADVASGKTFTSTAGLKVTGTANILSKNSFNLHVRNAASSAIVYGVFHQNNDDIVSTPGNVAVGEEKLIGTIRTSFSILTNATSIDYNTTQLTQKLKATTQFYMYYSTQRCYAYTFTGNASNMGDVYINLLL